jgi:deoxyribodipyrimidine photo-lyase
VATSIWWLRRDLRLSDNGALAAAAAQGSVVPVFVLDPKFAERAGAARMSFMLRNLRSLNDQIGGALVVVHGTPVEQIPRLAKALDVTDVHCARDFAPYGRARDQQVSAALAADGKRLVGSDSPYVVDPGVVLKDDGTALRVFTPFYKRWQQHEWKLIGDCSPTWKDASNFSDGIPDDPVCGATLPDAGEAAAWARWSSWAPRGLGDYKDVRNNPGIDGTSMLSAQLRFGVIHPRQLLAELPAGSGADHFRSEICWREFYADVTFHRPDSTWNNLQEKMNRLPVDTDVRAKQRYAAWCEARTGYPIVDAGMRQMLATGWMHNRVRMIVASFLVKDLHVPWQWGAAFFMRHLVDGDIASNNHGWQWTAGTGTDAAPYFRVFNPFGQSEKFDPDGTYLRTWIPEIADLDNAHIHAPWTLGLHAPAHYPAPIVDHAVEREEALARYKQVSGK